MQQHSISIILRHRCSIRKLYNSSISDHQELSTNCIVHHWLSVLVLWTRAVRRRRRAAAAPPPPPTECRRRAGAVFVTCSRHVVHQIYVARFL